MEAKERAAMLMIIDEYHNGRYNSHMSHYMITDLEPYLTERDTYVNPQLKQAGPPKKSTKGKFKKW